MIGISHNSLRAEWQNAEKIVDLDNIKSYEGEFNLSDNNWMKRYNSIMSKLESNIKFIQTDLNWINNQKHRKSKYKCEEDMLSKIPHYSTTDADRWNNQYDSVILFIKEDKPFNSKQKHGYLLKKRNLEKEIKKKFDKLLKMMQ